MSEVNDQAVAVIGVGARFPGATDAHAFWRNIKEGRAAISDAPPGRIEPEFFDPQVQAVDRIPTRRGGFLGESISFDPAAFGVMPVAAEGAEPDQLLTLQVAREALEDAGYAPETQRLGRVAVILGRGGYLNPGMTKIFQKIRSANEVIGVLRHLLPGVDEGRLAQIKEEFQARAGVYGPDTAIGLVPNLTASRVANRLDLRGPAFTLDAACASALIAVEQSFHELVSGRCDLALAGGVHLVHDASFWTVFAQLGALSRSGQIQPFGAGADGLLIGEGVGLVLLKRYDKALADGDRVYAVIRGVGSSSDGRATSVMVPRVEGQLDALARAWELAGLDPAQIGLVEGHGTATAAGDRAELETLARFFGPPGEGALAALGSVKSNIGHAMPAAGAAGLIKAVLAVHEGVIPPTLGAAAPAPGLAATRFELPQIARPWGGEGPRVAGVNAFGFGGINAHVVLSEAAPKARRGRRARPEDDAGVQALRLAAASPEALLARLDAGDLEPLGAGAARLALLDPTPARRARARDIVAKGRPWRGREGIWFSPRGLIAQGGQVVFLYPGVDAAFEPRVEGVAERFGLPAPRSFEGSELEQQGMAIVEHGRLLSAALAAMGLRPDAVAGHSIGEWSAMVATGMIPEDELETLLGGFEPGSLEVPGVLFAAVGCGLERAEAALEGLEQIAISHDNCPHQVILCGEEGAIHAAQGRLSAEGVFCQILPFRSGFHSPLFAPYLAPHQARFEAMRLAPARAPLWSATTCAPFPDDLDAVRALALRHLVEPVRFTSLIEGLYHQGARVFVQVGSGRLVGFVEDTLKGRPHLALSTTEARRPGLAQLRNLGLALWAEGAEPALDALVPPARAGRALELPLGAPLMRLGGPPLSLDGALSPGPLPAGDPVSDELGRTLQSLAQVQGEVRAAWQQWVARGRRPAPQGGVVTKDVTVTKNVTVTKTITISESAQNAPSSGSVAAPPPPRDPPGALRERLELSVERYPDLVDHSLIPQPPGWADLSDQNPVVPMTQTLELLMEGGQRLRPGQVVVALEEMRALRWIEVSPPLEVERLSLPLDDGRVRVSLEGYAEATLRFAPAYPPAPEDSGWSPPDLRPAPIDAQTLYADRWMFHGPAYQGVVELGPWSEQGILGRLRNPGAPGALLDNVGQLFGYWVMVSQPHDRLAMPVGLSALRLYGPHPPAGEELLCRVKITRCEAQEVSAEMELIDERGRVWCTISGWTDRRFPTSEALWHVLQHAERHTLSSARDPYHLFEPAQHRSPSRDWLSRRYLTAAERAAMIAAGPRGQRDFFNGRVAAKDALRRCLWAEGAGPIFPVELEVIRGAEGAPEVVGPHAGGLRVSIAHDGEVAVALAGRGPVGIDLERVEPRPEGFEEAAFSAQERALLTQAPGPGRDLEIARIWAAKEALGKARGTGLSPGPRALQASALQGARVEVAGEWIETRVERLDAGPLRVVAWWMGEGAEGGPGAHR